MATATFRAPSTGVLMHNGNIKPRNLSSEELKEVVRKVHALRRVSKATGFNTLHSIVEVLKPLSMDDLIAVGEELNLKPQEKARLTPQVNQ